MSSTGRPGRRKSASPRSSRSGSRPTALTTLPPDFVEFLKLLEDHQAEYLIIGGYAVGAHGHPRTTKDLDLWIGVTPDNVSRVVDAIRAFGFDLPNLTPALVSTPGNIIRMGHPPIRIEIFNEIPGVEFATCHARRYTIEVDGLPIPVIALDDLIANKTATGRAQDRADVEALRRTDPA